MAQGQDEQDQQPRTPASDQAALGNSFTGGMNRDLYEKICRKCNTVLEISLFGKSKAFKSGFHSTCRECRLKRHNELYRLRKISPKKEVVIPKGGHKICWTCKQEKVISEFRNNKRNKDRKLPSCKSCMSKHVKENKERYEEIKEYVRKYQKSERGKELTNISHRKSRKKNPHKYRLRSIVERLMRYKGERKVVKIEELLGYTYEQFANKFQIIEDFEIDHIIPLSWFLQTVPPNIANNLNNLQSVHYSYNAGKRDRFCEGVISEYYNDAIIWVSPEHKHKVKVLVNG